jgi:hypothetical protein
MKSISRTMLGIHTASLPTSRGTGMALMEEVNPRKKRETTRDLENILTGENG